VLLAVDIGEGKGPKHCNEGRAERDASPNPAAAAAPARNKPPKDADGENRAEHQQERQQGRHVAKELRVECPRNHEVGDSPREQNRSRCARASQPKPHQAPYQPCPADDGQRPCQPPLAELLNQVPVRNRADILPGVRWVHHAAHHRILRHYLTHVCAELKQGKGVRDRKGDHGNEACGGQLTEDVPGVRQEPGGIWRTLGWMRWRVQRCGKKRQGQHHGAEFRADRESRHHPGSDPGPASSLFGIARSKRDGSRYEEGKQSVDCRVVAELDGQDREGVRSGGEKACGVWQRCCRGTLETLRGQGPWNI